MKIEIKIHHLFDGKHYGVVKHMADNHLGIRVESTPLEDDLEQVKEDIKNKVEILLNDIQPPKND